jgi:hypothetical protein
MDKQTSSNPATPSAHRNTSKARPSPPALAHPQPCDAEQCCTKRIITTDGNCASPYYLSRHQKQTIMLEHHPMPQGDHAASQPQLLETNNHCLQPTWQNTANGAEQRAHVVLIGAHRGTQGCMSSTATRTTAAAAYAATMRCEEAAPAVVPAGAGRAALPTGMSV